MTRQPVPPALARRPATATAIVAGVVLVLLAWLEVPWSWVPGGTLRPLSPGAVFSADEIARAEAYASLRRVLGLSSLGVSLFTAMVLGFTTWGSRLARRLFGRLRWWLSVPVLVVALLLVGRLVTLPLSLAYREHNLAYGLTRQPLSGWIADYLKAFGLEALVGAALVVSMVGLARWTPRWWFAWAGVGAALLVFAGSFLYPVAVEPLFNRHVPMPEGALRQSILTLAERENVEIDEVLVADASRRTTTLNAYVSGLGATRRVVVYDNLLEDLPPDQVLSVVAHELAHAKNRDVLLGTTLGAVGALLGLSLLALALDSSRVRRRVGVSGPGDPAVVPLVLALVAVGALLASPAQNAVSRAIEVRADREALRTTGDPAAFLAVQHRLAVRSLADPTPPDLNQLWFGSHPTTLQRSGLPSSLERAGR